jgi:hypothetical protein
MKRAVFLFLAILTACSKRDASMSAPPSVRVGQQLKLDDSTWMVFDVKDVGKKIEPNNAFAETKETTGHFVLVRYKVTNTQKKPESILEPPKLVDDQSREYARLDSEAVYVPPKSQTLGIEQIDPRVEKEYATVFDAPADAKGLKLQVRGFSLIGEKRVIELGL